MSLYSADVTNYNPSSYSDSPSASKPLDNPQPPSPGDTRSKNARAQARHRAKRKAYVENLENTVHQLRAALSSGSGPDVVAQIQYLEQENAKLRAESQNLRAQLGLTASSSSTSPTTATYGYSSDNATGLRLPSVADAMNFRSSTTSSSSSGYSPSYLTEDPASRGRYYETNSDYRKRVSQPYSIPRRDSAGGPSYDKDYDADRVSGSGSTSRSSHRSYEGSPATAPTTDGTQGYYSSQLYGTSTSASFPPLSTTAGAYVFGEDVKPYVP